MVTDWAADLIGLPWTPGGRGPGEFDCWGLVVYVYQTVLGIELPAYPGIDPKNKLLVARLIRRGKHDSATWAELTKPVDLCVVGISGNHDIHHVGLWLDRDGGVVLHCMDGYGVVAQSRVSLAGMALRNLTFHQYVSGSC